MTTPTACFQCREPIAASGLGPHIRRRHPDLVLNDELLMRHGLAACPHCHQLFCATRGLAAHVRSCGRASAFSFEPPPSPIIALRGSSSDPISGSLARVPSDSEV